MTVSTLTSEPFAPPILVVDDDEAVRKFLVRGLRRMGYDAETATGVSAARERLVASPYSLVICDYEMGDGTGLDLLEFVNRHLKGLPFILLTAYDEVSLARTAMSAGATDFLAKPVELPQLNRVIEQNRARLEWDRQRTLDLTTEMLQGTIQALVAAVDAKDSYTACHSAEVTRISLLFGRKLGMPASRLRVLEFSALLHDVGKIAVPEHILRKAGPLTEEEWALMRTHPVRSAEIAGKVAQLSEVATIVRHHHENTDGTGYPDRLTGNRIPYLSRVIRIVDAYEAMTADRAYRPARPRSQAREIIAAGLGSEFDPQVGQAFLDLEMDR